MAGAGGIVLGFALDETHWRGERGNWLRDWFLLSVIVFLGGIYLWFNCLVFFDKGCYLCDEIVRLVLHIKAFVLANTRLTSQ